VGRGLATLAHHRFVHLDIKPDNVVVVCDGPVDDPESYPQAVLVDFGLARRLDMEDMVATLPPAVWSSEQLWGNPAHAAPELQLELKRVRRVGGPARLDLSKQPVFELGVLAYELCAGEHPVRGYPTVLEYGPEELEEVPTVYSEELVALCRSMVRVLAFVCGAGWCMCMNYCVFRAVLCSLLFCTSFFCSLQVAADPASRIDIRSAVTTLEGFEAAVWAGRRAAPLAAAPSSAHPGAGSSGGGGSAGAGTSPGHSVIRNMSRVSC
jgi:serine/threonine protein kinase